MVANQTEYCRHEQRSLIKSFVDDRCKPCDLYKRMYDMFGEECFSKKNCLEIGLNMNLPFLA